MGYPNGHNGPNEFLKSEEQHWTILNTTCICKIDSQWQFAVWCREPKAGTLWQPRGVCVGWGEVEWECKREGTYVYLRLIHVAVWQKLSQYCKVIILQLKLKYKLKRKSALVRGRYNREESSERYNFFWLWIWRKGAVSAKECGEPLGG